MDVMQLLVADINKHYNWYLDALDSDDWRSQLANVTVEEMYVFLALSYKWDMVSWTHWKNTGPLLNSSIHHFAVT
jgi:hypothetical protein